MSDKLHEKKCFKYLKISNIINENIISKHLDYKLNMIEE